MEVKNNNLEERKSSGKVLGHIAGGLRSLARPKKNTKWDYLVPLSLVGLQIIVFNYALMNTYDIVLNERINNLDNDSLIAESIYIILIILSIIFLTRLQRILILFILPISGILLTIIGEMSEVKIIETIAFFVFLLPLFSIEYFFGNISLLLKFGDNTEKVNNKKKYSLIRRVFSYAVYGFGLDILYLYIIPITLGSGIIRSFIFDGFYSAIEIPPMTPLFTILFALTGYIIEKIQRR